MRRNQDEPAFWVVQGNAPCYNKDMPKVTSKLQITLPKALATQYGIEPGDEIHFEGVPGAIRLIPAKRGSPRLSQQERARLFKESDQRLDLRQQWLKQCLAERPQAVAQNRDVPGEGEDPHGRGWTRASLYDREVFKRHEIDDAPSDEAPSEEGALDTRRDRRSS